MPQNSISAQLSNLHQLVADLEAIENGGKKAISNTIKDVKARAPGWIAQEVTAVYNIKKSEITPSGSGKPKKMAGSIQITGETIEELAITYKGRLLTPVHFGMTPKAPPRGKSYTLKASVLKGQKKVIGRYLNTRTPGGPFSQRSHNILMGTGNTKSDGTSWIPFQRMSKTRTDIKKLTTISVPQMITSDRTNEAIMLRLNTETSKRLEPHMQRALGLSARAHQNAAQRVHSRTRHRARPTPPDAHRARHSAAQTPPRPRTAPQGTVTGPSGLRCWRAQKTRNREKFFSGRFVSPERQKGGNAMPNPTNNKLVDSKTIAALFDMTPRRVQQLTKDGVIAAVKEGNANRYDLLPTIQRYIRYLTAKANGREPSKKDSEIEGRRLEAEADLKRSKADIAALQLSELEGTMHRSEDVEAVMTDLVYNIRSMLVALPGRLAVDVTGAATPAEASEIIRTEVYKILTELAGYKYDPEVYARRVRDREGWSEQLADDADD